MTIITPRLLTKTQAAEYCGLSAVTFGTVCPVRPIALGNGVRMHRYDVHEIDEWIDSFKTSTKHASVLAEIMWKKLDKPSTLEDKYLKIMKFMRDYPECDTSAAIRGAGERTLDILTEKKVVRVSGKDEAGRRRFVLTKFGEQELKNIEAWELESPRVG